MASYPSEGSITQITGTPTNGKVLWLWGDRGGASSSRFYAWAGVKVIDVDQSNWRIKARVGWSLYIEVGWKGYAGTLQTASSGYASGYAYRGGYNLWDWNRQQVSSRSVTGSESTTVYFPDGAYRWYHSGSLQLSYLSEGDYDYWYNDIWIYAGETVQLYSCTGPYSGGGYGGSEISPQAVRFPNAPTLTFMDGSTQVAANKQWEGNWFQFPADPIKTNYTFEGWYTEANGGTKVTSLKAGVSNQTLYAHWSLNGFPIIYNKNNTNAVGTMQNGEKPIDQPYTIVDCAYTLEDYSFVEWNTVADGSGTSLDPDDIIPAGVNHEITLYAQWHRNHHAPKFNGLPTVARCNSSGVQTDDGVYATISASFVYDSLWTTKVVMTAYYFSSVSDSWIQLSSVTRDNLTAGEHDVVVTADPLVILATQPSGGFSVDTSYKIKLQIQDYDANDQPYAGSVTYVETFLSSAFFYMDINPSTKVVAIGAGAGLTAATWDNDGNEEIDISGTVGTVDIHTNTLFSNDVYFHEDSQLILGGLEGNSGDVLVSGGTGAAPVWRSPINIKMDLIYDHTGSWWYSSAIGGGVPGDQYYDNGELIDGYSILDYKFLLLYFKAGNTSDLSNARGSVIVPVSGIHQWHSWDTINNYCVINEGQNCFDWVYSYPAADPAWFIDVAFGFFNDHHIYAVKRTTTNQNLHTWNLEQIWGIGFDPWGQGSAPLGYTRFTGPLSYTPSASQSVNIDTDGTYIDDDITVEQIHYAETDNQDGGITASIASN